MPVTRYHLVHWLREAYAMELQSAEALERQLRLPHDDKALQHRLEFHLNETLNQGEKLKLCIEHLGSDTQHIKVGLSKLIGNMHAISLALGAHEAVKTTIVNSVFEQFEISTYEAIIIAAHTAHETEVEEVCIGILGQEKAMAAWLEHHLPQVTKQYLEDSARAVAQRIHPGRDTRILGREQSGTRAG